MIETVYEEQQANNRKQVLLRDVWLPFLASRLLLMAAGYVSQLFPAYYNYPGEGVIERGWQFTPWKWIDFWGRWDTAWYMSIIEQGYVLRGDPAVVKSNIAFYPLYPYLVEWISALLPGTPDRVTYLIVGLLLSNVAALIALTLIYQLARRYLSNRQQARNAILLMLAFPSGFILSCFYTEAVFLALAAAALWFGSRRQWAAACLCIMLAAVSRPVGLGLAAPVAYMYMEARNWEFRRIRPDVLWFLLTLPAYLYFLYHIEQTTGDFRTTFQVQQSWDRHLSWPWRTLIYPYGWNIYHTPIQQLLTLVFFYGIYQAFRLLPAKSLPLMAVIILLPIYFTGRLSSSIRFYLMAFPVFMAYAVLIPKKWILYSLLTAAGLLQLIYFMGWVRFYWIL